MSQPGLIFVKYWQKQILFEIIEPLITFSSSKNDIVVPFLFPEAMVVETKNGREIKDEIIRYSSTIIP